MAENLIQVGNNETVNGTNGDDKFVISEKVNTTIVTGNKGIDTIYFDFESLFVVSANAIENSKDLRIVYYFGPNEYYRITVKDYFTNTNHTDTKSSLKNIYYVNRFQETKEELLTDIFEFNGTYTQKGTTLTGSKLNDNIDVSRKDEGYTINGGDGNDHLAGSKGNDKINGGNGDATYIAFNGGSDDDLIVSNSLFVFQKDALNEKNIRTLFNNPEKAAGVLQIANYCPKMKELKQTTQ